MYLAKMTACVVALQSMRSFAKTQYSMTQKAVYFVADEIDRVAGEIRATHLDFRYQPIAEPEETGNGGRRMCSLIFVSPRARVGRWGWHLTLPNKNTEAGTKLRTLAYVDRFAN